MVSYNKFYVGLRGEEVIIGKPVLRMNREDALNLAVWLVLMSEVGREESGIEEFAKLYDEAVEG